MKKLLLSLVAVLIVAGCENNTTSPYDISSDPELTDPVEGQPDLYDYEADAAYLSAPLSQIDAFILIWRDLVRPFDNTWIIDQLGPGLFEITRYAVITGTLHVQWDDSSVTDKGFTCNGTKHAVVSRPARGTPGVLQQISPTLIETDGGQMVITRVEIVTAASTYVIDDPLQLIDFPDGLLHLNPMEEVTVRVWGPPSDAIVVLRVPATLPDFANFVMQPVGDCFEGQWHAPQYPGLRRVGIDVLSHATVYDHQASYDGTAWLFPYMVR